MHEKKIGAGLEFVFLKPFVSDTEPRQSEQPFVERKVHPQPVSRRSALHGGGAVLQRRTQKRGVFRRVSVFSEIQFLKD